MVNKKLLLLCCIGSLSVQISAAKTSDYVQNTGSNVNGTSALLNKSHKGFGNSLRKNVPCLVENVGQIKDQFGAMRNDIDFKLPGDFFNVFIGSGAIQYQWIQASSKNNDGPASLQTYRMDMQLIGANHDAVVSKSFVQAYKEQFISDAKVTKEAKGYEKVSYKNIYPNIDWELYLKNGKLEYDFVVHPGGNVADIKIKYNGATKINRKSDGSIAAYTPAGYVNEHAPYSYSKGNNGSKTPIKSSFIVKDDITTFAVGKYQGTLIIDPVLDWATYYGGSSTEDGYGVAVDPSGNVYMTGYTLSLTNIATTGSYQSTFTAGPLSALDAYLVKFDSTGVRQWATYFGSDGSDNATCVHCDADGNVYIAGSTSSLQTIATTGSHQNTIGGATDAFLAKFSTTGSLIWSTYYGGTSASANADYAYALQSDNQGNIYMAGQTNSPNNIATPGSYQLVFAGVSDGFVVKFNSAGVRQWGTYLGGTANDQARALSLDKTGNIYVGGGTSSVAGIASAGTAQTTLGGNSDGFLIKLNNEGTYQWGTYFGGTDYDGVNGLSCDDDLNIYMTGSVGNTSAGLSSTGSYQATQAGNGDAYLVKYDSTGHKIWSTYYGGTGIDQSNAVKYDGFGNVYILGSTKSATGIATAGTFQDTISLNGTNYEAFLVKFKANGTRTWATYYGGKGDDYGKALAMNKTTGDIFFSGQTKSTVHIATPGSQQDTIGSLNGTDAFLVKFNECPTISNLSISDIYGTDSICPHITTLYGITPLPGVTAYTWTLPNGWTGTSDSASILVTTGITGGTIEVKASNSCDSLPVKSMNVYVYPFFVPVITVDSLNLGTASPYASYQWYLNGQLITGATGSIYHVTQNGNYTVAVVSADGCTDTSEIYIVNNVTTGIKDADNIKTQIHIYPNPSISFINISSPVKVDVIITTLEGRTLGAYKNAKTISIKDLAAGIYLMRISDASGVFIKAEKFIKE